MSRFNAPSGVYRLEQNKFSVVSDYTQIFKLFSGDPNSSNIDSSNSTLTTVALALYGEGLVLNKPHNNTPSSTTPELADSLNATAMLGLAIRFEHETYFCYLLDSVKPLIHGLIENPNIIKVFLHYRSTLDLLERWLEAPVRTVRTGDIIIHLKRRGLHKIGKKLSRKISSFSELYTRVGQVRTHYIDSLKVQAGWRNTDHSYCVRRAQLLERLSCFNEVLAVRGPLHYIHLLASIRPNPGLPNRDQWFQRLFSHLITLLQARALVCKNFCIYLPNTHHIDDG
jgi:hypothetical protein